LGKEKKEFPKKPFVVEGNQKLYCSYLFFTKSILNIQNKNDFVAYKCLLCKIVINCKPAYSRNIKRHLETSCKNKKLIIDWMKLYNASQNVIHKQISDEMLKLILFFISSNTSLVQLDNPYFRSLMTFNLPSARYFNDTLLPKTLEQLYEKINEKLIDSEYICLISDIWTTRTMYDFMGLAACIF
jgi:hypothetical protein